MFDIQILIIEIKKFFTSELGRVLTSGFIFLCCFALSRISKAYVYRQSLSVEAKREKLVWVKNGIWVAGTLAVITVWASKIAGFALSIAAFAGALLIVSKEMLTCFMGYALITFTRPYRIGDFVEIGTNAGRVIDIDAFFTTLAETGLVNQLTGKTMLVPNSLLLANPVKNQSATGKYIVDLYRIVVPFDIDIAIADSCAIDASTKVTAHWQGLANEHFEHIESRQFLDLPSSRPKVLWASLDTRQHQMTIRFSCPLEERVDTEQAIFREFWRLYRERIGAPQVSASS